MKKEIKVLEEKLKKITGEDKLRFGELGEMKKRKTFDAHVFTKLAKQVKKILTEDGTYTNPSLKS